MTLTAIMAAAPVYRIKLEPIGNSAPASIGPIPAPRSLHTVQAAKASTRAGPGFCMATIGDTIGITSERKITTATALIQSHSNPIPNMATDQRCCRCDFALTRDSYGIAYRCHAKSWSRSCGGLSGLHRMEGPRRRYRAYARWCTVTNRLQFDPLHWCSGHDCRQCHCLLFRVEEIRSVSSG